MAINNLKEDIQQLLEQYQGDLDEDTMRKEIMTAIKKKPKYEMLQKAMRELVQEFPTITLKKMRKELKNAYTEIIGEGDGEGNSDDVRSRGPTAYNLFMKEQIAILKTEMPNATQKERMAEVGKRWKDFKNTQTMQEDNESENDSEDVPSPPRKKTRGGETSSAKKDKETPKKQTPKRQAKK